MEKQNYQKLMEEQIASLDGVPTLLLQSCCGPCSSYVLEVLAQYFNVTVLYYNPNIYPEEEYNKRLSEQIKIINSMPLKNKVELMPCDYDEQEFLDIAKGFESEREGGARCKECFVLRLGKTAALAKEKGFDFFTTTLTVSPHKNAQLLNQIGKELEEKYGVKYLFADFKKKEGYKRSIQLSKEYDLYRQEYCGCRFSLKVEQP
ncbi:MAG: epoxyqueuosine reductase QueH [Clostridia bacterium]|nr:epoxyqueuosine reductase QueH [Clostridia bacterium]